jgi:anti-sigma B factor antagonist
MRSDRFSYMTTTAPDDSAVVVSVRGDLDLASSPTLRRIVSAVSASHGRDREQANIVIDLSRVTFLDASGVGALVSAAQSAQRDGHALSLRDPSPCCVRVLEITRLLSAFRIEAGPARCGVGNAQPRPGFRPSRSVELGEETGQLLQIRGVPGRETVVEDAPLPLERAGHVAAAGGGEADGVRTAVGAIGAHGDETRGAELIDQSADGAAVHGHAAGDVVRSARADCEEPSGDVEGGRRLFGIEPTGCLDRQGAGGGDEVGQLHADRVEHHRAVVVCRASGSR